MTLRKPARSELVLVGLIVLLLTTIALLPWKQFSALNSEVQNSKYAFVNMRRGTPRNKSISPWRASAEYSTSSGTLMVNLTNKYDEPADELWLRADFTTGSTRAPVAAALLRSLPGGHFRSDKLHLSRGDWIVGLTGTRRSEFVFRIEQKMSVK